MPAQVTEDFLSIENLLLTGCEDRRLLVEEVTILIRQMRFRCRDIERDT